MSDFIAIRFNRMKPSVLKNAHKDIIITSQNGVEALLNNYSPMELNFENIYCVGRRTKRLIEKKIGKVTHIENSAKELANHIVRMKNTKALTYFCGNLKQDDLTSILSENGIVVDEVEAYRTVLNEREFEETFDGILFYSPSGVQSYLVSNSDTNAVAFCIGETTATEAKKHFEKVEVSKLPSIENVIKLVNKYFE